MTLAEVLAMRNRLAEDMWEAKLGVFYDDCVSVADWLLTSRLTLEKIAEVLSEHQYREFPAGNCMCGVDGIATTGSHENHVAQVIIKSMTG